MTHYDAIVIGAGQSGPSSVIWLAGPGRQAAIVEQVSVGGIWVNTGCTPSKALVAGAYATQKIRRGVDYDIVLNRPVQVDIVQVEARVDGVVAERRNGLHSAFNDIENCMVVYGHVSLRRQSSGNFGEAPTEALRARQSSKFRMAVLVGLPSERSSHSSKMLRVGRRLHINYGDFAMYWNTPWTE